MKLCNIIPVFLMTFGLAVHSYAGDHYADRGRINTIVVDGGVDGGTHRAGTVIVDGNTGADSVDAKIVVVDGGVGADDVADDTRTCSERNLSGLQKMYLDQFAEKHYCFEDYSRMASSMANLLSGFRQGRIRMATPNGGTVFHPDELMAYSLAGYQMRSFLVMKHRHNSKRLIIVNLRHPSSEDAASASVAEALANFHEVVGNYPSDGAEVEAAIAAIQEAGTVARGEKDYNEIYEGASVQAVFESMEITEGFQRGWYLFDL